LCNDLIDACIYSMPGIITLYPPPAYISGMRSRIFKKVSFDASHRLLHYEGKCARLHGHSWSVEVCIDGEVDEKTGILIDYNTIRSIIERFDHQVILNEADPMVRCIGEFQQVCTTHGDPTSELLAVIIHDLLDTECTRTGRDVRLRLVRVWESPTCYAEWSNADH
jgi:6-pyruvoyltetrahydropterin/6-carboxytetrahydropterin synthase